MRYFQRFKFRIFLARMAIVLVGVFGFVILIGVSVGMDQAMGSMTDKNCIFDDGSGCAMNFNEHLALWEQVFTANIFNWKIEFVLLMTLLVPFCFAVLMEKVVMLFALPGEPPPLYYDRQNSLLKLFDPVLQALSGGRFQPKIQYRVGF